MKYIKSLILTAGAFLFVYWIAFTPQDLMAGNGRYGGWHMDQGFMGGWGMGWMMLVFWGLVLVGLVLIIRWLFQLSIKDRPGFSGGSNAIEILKERYARGEIDKAEFESKKKDLA